MADTPIKDYEKLDTESKATIAANARSQGITPQEYLASRGGVYESGYFGDTPEFRRLSEADYTAAQAKGSGAINTALFNQIKEAYKNNPNLIEDPYLRLAYQNKTITLDQLMQGLNPDTFGKRGFGTSAKGKGLNSIGALADGTPLYGWDDKGKPVTDPYGTVYSTTSSSDAITKASSGASPIGVIATTATPTGLDSTTSDLIKSLQAQITALTTGNTETAAATKAAEKLAERQSAFDLLRSEMDALGLGALVEPLRGLIQKDVGAAEFAIQLRQSEAYKARFAANEGRLKKGLRVLTPGEYLRVEDAYRQTLRTYGLKQFDNDQYVRQFIENDISAAELSDRVATAVQRVQNADPAIGRTLRDYYGIGQTDLVAYVLDPNQQLQKIQRQVAAAEIGTAARRQGLEAGVTVSEQLAAQGITEAEAQRGYATIADVLPTAEKLSQIYGTTLEGYDQAQAEQEVFNQLASAQRKRQRLVSREIAEFSGQSGVGRGSLGTATGGQY